MSERDPAKRIPKAIGTETTLFGTYTLSDVAVGLFPGVLVILFTQIVLPSPFEIHGYSIRSVSLPLAGVAVAIGGLFVYLTPNYTTSIDWIGTFFRFRRNPSHLPHHEAAALTHLHRVHPERGAIERIDGAFIGMVQVDPPTMALATDDEWRAKAAAFQDFLNTTVEFPIQIYSTTQPFPASEYLSRYTARREDPDVKANPRLESLIEHYVEWYAADLDERRMTIRDHYVVVTVSPREVQFDRESPLQQLARLPGIGLVFRVWFAPRPEEIREAMFDALDTRVDRVESGLRDIEGCDARRTPAGEATRLVGEFWAGDPLEYGDMRRILRTRPIVGRDDDS